MAALADQTVRFLARRFCRNRRGRSPFSVQKTVSPLAPWIQLVAGVICMAMIANLQYGWTIFVAPIDAKHHWGKAAIQGTFTLLFCWRPGLCRLRLILPIASAPVSW